MDATGELLAEMERGEIGVQTRLGEGEEEGALCPALSRRGREREQEGSGTGDLPGAPSEPGDAATDEGGEPTVDVGDWRERAESAESMVAELGNRLGAVEAAADDLRRMVGASELARRVDRELLIAGVVNLDGARALVEEQVAGGATVLEAVARVRERRPLLFASRVRGLRATAMPASGAGASRSVDEMAAAARATGDRRLLLRYLRMRRGEG